jgi:Zn ribbon nucleic-acid-binding protein
MTMPIYSKSCPHCKNGDITIEEFVDKSIGTQRAVRCFQCGWQKIISFPSC